MCDTRYIWCVTRSHVNGLMSVWLSLSYQLSFLLHNTSISWRGNDWPGEHQTTHCYNFPIHYIRILKEVPISWLLRRAASWSRSGLLSITGDISPWIRKLKAGSSATHPHDNTTPHPLEICDNGLYAVTPLLYRAGHCHHTMPLPDLSCAAWRTCQRKAVKWQHKQVSQPPVASVWVLGSSQWVASVPRMSSQRVDTGGDKIGGVVEVVAVYTGGCSLPTWAVLATLATRTLARSPAGQPVQPAPAKELLVIDRA